MKRKLFSLALIAVVAGAGAFAFLGSASATASGTSYASVTELHGESYNGQVDDITVSSTGYVEWENMPNVGEVRVTLEAKNGSNWEEFASESYTDAPNQASGDYSYDVVSGKIIENTSLKSQAFSSDTDGETRKQYVPVRVTVEVVSEDGETVCEFSEVHKVKTKVTNLTEPKLVDGGNEIDGTIHMNETAPACETC